MTVKTAPTFTAAAANNFRERSGSRTGDPIIAAVDGSEASGAAIDAAVHLGAELNAPVVFVHVRRGPAGFFGSPVYQRRLTKKMAHARRVLDRALAIAVRAGVPAQGEILEGVPHQRIAAFARDRDAQAVVVGSRKWRLGRSVSSGVRRAAERPVIIARAARRLRGGEVSLLDRQSLPSARSWTREPS
jgi:nucleotide-binding universal stress UspA family protein